MESNEVKGLDPFRSRDKIPRTPPALDGTLLSNDLSFAASPPDDLDLSVSMFQTDPNHSRFFIKINDIPRPSGVKRKKTNRKALGTSVLENSHVEPNIKLPVPPTTSVAKPIPETIMVEEVWKEEQSPRAVTVNKKKPAGRPRKSQTSASSSPEVVTVKRNPRSRRKQLISPSPSPETSNLFSTPQTVINKPSAVNKEDEATVKKEMTIPIFAPFPAIQPPKRPFNIDPDDLCSTPKRVCNEDNHFASTPVTIKQKRGSEDTPLAVTDINFGKLHSEPASSTPVTVVRRPIRRRVAVCPPSPSLSDVSTVSGRYNLRRKDTPVSDTLSTSTTVSTRKPPTRKAKVDATMDEQLDETVISAASSTTSSVDSQGCRRSRRNVSRVNYAV